jgi:hypothetical protein
MRDGLGGVVVVASRPPMETPTAMRESTPVVVTTPRQPHRKTAERLINTKNTRKGLLGPLMVCKSAEVVAMSML